MAIDVVVTNSKLAREPAPRAFLEYLRDNDAALSLTNAVAYYDFPSYVDYETITHRADIVILSPMHGVVCISFAPLMQEHDLSALDMLLTDYASNLVSRLLKSRILRKSLNQLSFPVTPVIMAVNGEAVGQLDATVCASYQGFADWLQGVSDHYLEQSALAEARSVLEGAKALTRTQKRSISDPKASPIAAALAQLEAEIANFDENQRRVALVDVGGPARIRGLAGSGKTVILAMKAAQIHMDSPDHKVLVTFYTRSLRATLKTLITRFYRHYSETDPDWNKIHIRHGWGSSSGPGVYADTSRRYNRSPMPLTEAQKAAGPGKNAFGWAVNDLVESVDVEPFYDHVLIDEGQDFPDSFYRLCYHLAKGDRDKKNIVWAYDELQNILNVQMRRPEQLFGKDRDGEYRVDLDRSGATLPLGASNDTVLSKTYRNQRNVLVSAHAMGFGVYGNIVQMLEGAEHWKDVGYEVNNEPVEIGKEIELFRPVENSPLDLPPIENLPIIDSHSASNFDTEVIWVATEIRKFIAGGLNPEDVLVISLDDRNAKRYFKAISQNLAESDISSNNIIADPYNEPPFSIPGKITLSTVYRAKGNEAALVLCVGVDAVTTRDRSGRNKLFTAFTRTKGWLRVCGVGASASTINAELTTAAMTAPYMRFVMPDPLEIDTIQRGLSDKKIKAKALRDRYLKDLKEAGLTEEEISEQLKADVI